MVIGIPPRLLFGLSYLSEGQPGRFWVEVLAALIPALGLMVLRAKPGWYTWVVNALLAGILLENLAATLVAGGLVNAELAVAFGFVVVVGALIALDIRAGWWWFLAYIVNLVAAVVLSDRIEPINEVEASQADIASTLIGTAVLLFAGMAYFVRQRDRFQRESDDLLHNILPDEIAARLKSERTMIADDFDDASVLFADIVGFTPMSAEMTPPQLVGLLNTVFSTFDGFVAELGLEKIKTVGDEYMVASGVPHPRSDHALAIAALALRMRNHVEVHDFDGHKISLRIGINSGPVVAGIVGTHKFSYDLWGDVVNTASRMESEGVPGSIQISSTTHELIKNDFVCEPRGAVAVKGKGHMETYFLLSPSVPSAVPSIEQDHAREPNP
jgi:guanylate cyclase